jgi:hypothetical protein
MLTGVKHRITAKFKKHKHWFIAALVLDILSIPAAAQIVDHVSFSVPQKVASVRLDVQQEGLQRFVVASNGPFAVISENAIGEFNVRLRTNDNIKGQSIGENAQLPGSNTGCALATAQSPQKIYEAIRKTAKKRGEVLSQAVIVEISYDPVLDPNFKIVTGQNAFSITQAGACHIA